MAGVTGPTRVRWTERAARRRQHEFWDAAHTLGWGPGSGPSKLARWSEACLPADGRGQRLLELGFGTGSDLEVFVRRGFTVAGVELSRVAAGRARLRSRELPRPDGVPRPILDTGDATEFLATQPDGSAAVAYANLLHSMAVPPTAERRRWNEVARVLAPGGLHIYSVRTPEDPWFGVGVRRGPWTFDPGADGPPLRFFREAETLRKIRGTFEPVARAHGREGSGRYVRDVLYAIDRKDSGPPRKAGKRKG
jgi:SAM-dependent methyltransferase